MATNQTVSYKFDWGEPVKIIGGSPQKYLDIAQGSVCGIRKIETEVVSKDFNEPIGTVLYLVEASNGEAIEIPEKYLSAFD
ncbi:MAG: hypothetical protein P8Y45_19785 [Exilibacterium sp.]